MHTGVISTLNKSKDGFSNGYIDVPWSIDRSPYYRVRVPFFRRKSGDGKRLLLIGGNHGDEYEGPLALYRLIRALESCDMQGEITILPSLNRPAVDAARRCSPLDSANMNRMFGTPPVANPTWRIAHYLETDLMPHHDALFDLHSGGTTMEHALCGLCEPHEDPEILAWQRALLEAMQLPYSFLGNSAPDSPTSMGAANRCDIVGVSGEFGGGGTATARSVEATACAIDGVLQALDITSRPLISAPQPPPAAMRFLRLGAEKHFVYATETGWFEPKAELGDTVSAGQLAGLMHDPGAPVRAPLEYRFAGDGIVLARRLPTPSLAGDCLFAIGGPETGDR